MLIAGSATTSTDAETWESRRVPRTVFRLAIIAGQERFFVCKEREIIAHGPGAGQLIYHESLRSLAIAWDGLHSNQRAEERVQAAVLKLEAGQEDRDNTSIFAVEAERSFCKASKIAELLRGGAESAKNAARINQSTPLSAELTNTADVAEAAASSVEAETALLRISIYLVYWKSVPAQRTCGHLREKKKFKNLKFVWRLNKRS